MKRMMPTITLCLASLLPLFANADGGNLNSFLRGDYDVTGDNSCIASSTGFSGSYANNPASAYSNSVDGVHHFNGDGTGTVVSGRYISIPNGNNGTGIGPVTVGTFSADFTYTVSPDHSIHIAFGPLTNVQTVGPDPGLTEVTTGGRLDGHVSQDFNTITAANAAPTSNPSGLTPEHGQYTLNPRGTLPPDETIACHSSRVMVKIDGGPGRDASQTVSPFSR